MEKALLVKLDDRVKEIVDLHDEIRGFFEKSVGSAIRIGQLLGEQKAELPHGQFTTWVESNMPFTPRTARNYMRLFDNREQLKSESVSDLGEAYRLLAPPRESEKPREKGADEEPEMIRQVLPPDGYVLEGRDEDWCVFIAQHVQPGYYFVTSWQGGASAMGTKRGIQEKYVAMVLGAMEVPSELEWNTWPSDPWDYNEMLYMDRDENIQMAILGQN